MPIFLNIFFSLAISFTIVYFIIPGIIKAARAKKLFDVPNSRSAARQVVPTLGGIAIMAGFILGLIISSDSFGIDDLKYLFASVTVMFVIGLNDDILGSSARRKLVIELLMAFYLVILGDYRFTDLHGILGINQIGYISGVILSVFAIVGIVNAVNLIDGIDGLASGIGILISTVYGFWFLNAGDYIYSLTCFSLTGSLGAFFLYNVFGKQNKIFMGDTGSLIVGTIIAILTIHFNEFVPTSVLPVSGLPAISLAIIIVPVVDTIRVFTIRLMSKKSPFSPDMNHLHHNLLRLTNSHLKSSLIIIGTNGIFILIAITLVDQMGNNLLFFSLLVSGLLMADIPVWILEWSEKNPAHFGENKSVFELISLKKKAG
jgi:UDP-N-acetylmuramyl pentapeptide phosphotransferase/UDP-N-acetylglucosamine-1-phosphate transferase